MFRLFSSPRGRIMEALGLPVARDAFEEFWALRDISFSVKRGERLGLVGRNGAGKSTLLKLIAGQHQPTSGSLFVDGRVQALMELGTGFHPEFTGRQNVLSALAYQGVTGKAANRLLGEILEFTELDEFGDKPLKTYSAGMYARLAFAASTAIRPELLIIDEILGAGDAYFAAKCADRMRQLTSEGTTVLFVSHDISAVQMICDRAIWIERGRQVMDSDPHDVSRSYAASIRKQSEIRLRSLNLKLQRGHISELLTDTETDKVFIFRLVNQDGIAPAVPVAVYEIELMHKRDVVDRVLVGHARDDDRSERVHVLTAKGFMEWSDPESKGGERFRTVGRFGGSYQHAPFSVRVPMGLGPLSEFSVRIRHGEVDPAEHLHVQVFDGVEYLKIGELGSGVDDARTTAVSLAPLDMTRPAEEAPVAPDEFSYGSRDVWITSVDFLDAADESKRVFAFGESMRVRIGWCSKGDQDNIVAVVCVYSLDGRCATQVLSPALSTKGHGRSGVVTATFDPLCVGKGDYSVSIGLFDGLTEVDHSGTRPFDVQDRHHRLRVTAPLGVNIERGQTVHAVEWQFAKASDAADL